MDFSIISLTILVIIGGGECGWDWQSIDKNDYNTNKVANAAISYISDISNNDYQMKLIKINSGQLKSGKYVSDFKLNLLVGFSDCSKDDYVPIEQCQIDKNHVRHRLDLVVDI